jgi:hypothetical protein
VRPQHEGRRGRRYLPYAFDRIDRILKELELDLLGNKDIILIDARRTIYHRTQGFQSCAPHSNRSVLLSGPARLSGRQPLAEAEVYEMIRRWALTARHQHEDLVSYLPRHRRHRYLQNGSKLEIAQQMATHEFARTTGL